MMPMMPRKPARLALLTLTLFVLSMAGCIGANPADASLLTPLPQPTATSTIEWFPPTPTPTFLPRPTIQPTIDMRPNLGDVLLSDDFSQPGAWSTGESTNGSIAYNPGKLTLAVSRPGGYLSSLRADTQLTDFYLEITANPVLCRGEDTYGVLFREIAGSSYYRLLLNCNGLLRLERISYSDILILQKWQGSDQLAPGSPLTVRVGLWVRGSTLRVFLNGSFQFEVSDVRFPSGGIGVFAISKGTTAVTVNFSDLQVRALTP
jgi:hypothetical protein